MADDKKRKTDPDEARKGGESVIDEIETHESTTTGPGEHLGMGHEVTGQAPTSGPIGTGPHGEEDEEEKEGPDERDRTES